MNNDELLLEILTTLKAILEAIKPEEITEPEMVQPLPSYKEVPEPPVPPFVSVTSYAHVSELAPITQALKEAGMQDVNECKAWLTEQGYGNPHQIPVAKLQGLLSAAKALQPLLAGARALAGATGGEVVNVEA
jgi:hypothetical protein